MLKTANQPWQGSLHSMARQLKTSWTCKQLVLVLVLVLVQLDITLCFEYSAQASAGVLHCGRSVNARQGPKEAAATDGN